jgi:hypothetical protein
MQAASGEPKTLCFDLDNTLCSTSGMEYDKAEPFDWAIERVNRLAAAGHTIVIMTARGSATGIDWEPVTRGQLERWGVTYHELRFGKPPADVFVDDRAVHTTAWLLDDAFAVPGLDPAGSPRPYPMPPPPPAPVVVETSRTYAGRTLRLAEHAERARAVARAAGIAIVPSVAEIEEAVARSLPAGEGDVAFDVRISGRASAAYPEAWDADAPFGLHVSCRPLAEVARALARSPGPPYGTGDEVGIVASHGVVLSPVPVPPSVAGRWLEELAEVERRELESGELESADESFVLGLPFCLLPLRSGPVTGELLERWSEAAGVDLRMPAEEVPASL